MSKSRQVPAGSDPLSIESEADLRANLRQICRRLGANPSVSRLMFVNPLLVLEDVGVRLSPAMRQHIMDALRFPPRRRERLASVERELAAEAEQRGLSVTFPLDDATRERLASQISHGDRPLTAGLAEYARLRRGAMVFFPREVYEQFKRGEKKHRWIKAVRFKV